MTLPARDARRLGQSRALVKFNMPAHRHRQPAKGEPKPASISRRMVSRASYPFLKPKQPAA